MKNNIKKLLLPIVVAALIAPSIALAAWWNPLSWFNHWGMGRVDFPQATVEKNTVPVAKPPATVKPAAVPTKTAVPTVKTPAPSGGQKTKVSPATPPETTTQQKSWMVIPPNQPNSYRVIADKATECIISKAPSCYDNFMNSLTPTDCGNIMVNEPEKVQKQFVKNSCFKFIGIKEADISICKKMETYDDGMYDDCALGVFRKTLDPQICESMTEQRHKTACLFSLQGYAQ